VNGEFLWHLEDILDLYAEPDDPWYPVVCFDECPIQLVSEVRQPLPARPGRPRRYDYQYRREGTCNLFMAFCPRRGWRHVWVTARRTKADFAECMRQLVDVCFPNARRIRVVLDNLNTHTFAALYDTFPPEQARHLMHKLEFHFTPKHASWLNMVELELAVLRRQCLDRRLDSARQVQHEAWLWQAPRNAAQATVHWHFTTLHARTHLKSWYNRS
jgi:hypothetical protein